MEVKIEELPQDDPITKQVVENVVRRHGDIETVTDEQGRKHHTLYVDPLRLGVVLGGTGNKKAAEEVVPRRPTFGEFLKELYEREPPK